METLWVGAGRREIQIPEEYRKVEGFTSIHDPIYARAVVIRQKETAAILSLEMTSLPDSEAEAIRGAVSEKTGIRRDHIWVCVTHTFSVPHLLPDFLLRTKENVAGKEAYRDTIWQAACCAAEQARKDMRPAKMGVGTGFCDIVANRDVELSEGWWVGVNGGGPTDPTVTVLRFDDMEGAPVALISHFAVQSSVMDQSELSAGGKAVTGDLAGMACRAVEEEYGRGLVSLFLMGAAGDQAPIEKAVYETFQEGRRIRTDIHEAGFSICEGLASRLSREICEIAGRTVCAESALPLQMASRAVRVPAKRMEGDTHSLVPTRNCAYISEGEKETVITALRVGQIGLLGVTPELNRKTAADITEAVEAGKALVCTMVNGASKYMADEAAFDQCRYEAMNSPWDRGAAEKLAREGGKLLRSLLAE